MILIQFTDAISSLNGFTNLCVHPIHFAVAGCLAKAHNPIAPWSACKECTQAGSGAPVSPSHHNAGLRSPAPGVTAVLLEDVIAGDPARSTRSLTVPQTLPD